MNPCSQIRHCLLNSDFDPEITISLILLPAMSPGNLINLILVANVNVSMPDQSMMGVDYTLREQNTFQSAILYCHTHPQCITRMGYTGNPIYNHYWLIEILC